ncbi:MAG: AAA family ATPase [Magnetococcus sp. DMHC-6]
MRTPAIFSKHNEYRLLPFIETFNIRNFREYPLQKEFNFGKVNIFIGPNASGKTSILEAIELYYCGKNNRDSKNRSINYRFEVSFKDGSSEIVNHNSLKTQDYRDRNMIWYGQSEGQTNYLFNSFSIFNFLDTDAAVNLQNNEYKSENEKKDFINSISSLLGGPETSRIFRLMNQVYEKLITVYRLRSKDEENFKIRKFELEKKLETLNEIQKKSALIYVKLEKNVRDLGWGFDISNSKVFAIKLSNSLSEILFVVNKLKEIDWLESPLSMNKIGEYCQKSRLIIQSIDPYVNEFMSLLDEEKKVKNELFGKKFVYDIIEKLIKIENSNILVYHDNVDKNQHFVNLCKKKLCHISIENVDFISLLNLHKRLLNDVFVEYERQQYENKNDYLEIKKEYNNIVNLQKNTNELADRLRQVAMEIIHNSPNKDECPLCHTQFQTGMLAFQIDNGVNNFANKSLVFLVEKMKKIESDLRNNEKIILALTELIDFCKSSEFEKNVSVEFALSSVQEIFSQLKRAETSLELNKKLLSRTETVEISKNEFNINLQKLIENGYSYTETSLSVLKDEIESKIKLMESCLENISERKTFNKERISSILKTSFGIENEKGLYEKLKNNLAETELLYKMLNNFFVRFPWPSDKSLYEFVLNAESVRLLADNLIKELKNEEHVVGDSVLVKEKQSLEKKLEECGKKLKNLSMAKTILEDLTTKHTVEKANVSVLEKIHDNVNKIFSRIHYPPEFAGIDISNLSLTRNDGSLSTLNQISTGQRTAFALSVFLAQNAQLTDLAPPVILMDDVISHVDDLNTLAFIDYLRELVLTSRRQIFFATPSRKLATLFRRKFDFLGDDFREFEFKR